MLTHKVPETAAGQRLSRYLKTLLPHIPYVGLQKLIRTGKIRQNGKRTKPDAKVEAADILTLPTTEKEIHTESRASKAYTATRADLAELEGMKIYEDKNLLILNKTGGLASQAGSGISKSLDRLLAAAYGAEKAPKLAHRLDRDTTGLIIAGKNRTMAAALAAQFQGRTMQKTYLLLAHNPEGKLKKGQTGNFRESLEKQGPMAVVSTNGDPAHTSFKVLATKEDLALAEATPHTGRMNQIRAHFAHYGTPLVGDRKYGPHATSSQILPKPCPLFLHAWKLTFTHPKTEEPLTPEAPVPSYFHPFLEDIS